MDYDYYDDDDDDRRWPKRVALVVVFLLLAAGGAFLVTRRNDRASVSVTNPVATDVPTAPTTKFTLYDAFPIESVLIDSSPTSSSAVARVLPPVPTSDSTTTTGAPANGSVPSNTPATSPSVAPGTPYVMQPDGSPQPVVAIFDTSTITLTGELPSQDAVTKLEAFAVANTQTPARIINNLIINPGVPLNVGVRLIELNWARFPSGSATILADQAAELSRVVRLLNASPHVSVLVVGHADQIGTENLNYPLSVDRAQAVVNYLIFSGISAARISSRGVGSSDLLTAAGDDVALALNRRTEFIFSGLLAP